MFAWAVAFLVIALVSGVLGFGALAGTAADVAWLLFAAGLILAIVFAAIGWRNPPL
jgi:uncharacterized membrane protein YtjA (UPF0391 family)